MSIFGQDRDSNPRPPGYELESYLAHLRPPSCPLSVAWRSLSQGDLVLVAESMLAHFPAGRKLLAFKLKATAYGFLGQRFRSY